MLWPPDLVARLSVRARGGRTSSSDICQHPEMEVANHAPIDNPQGWAVEER